MFEYDLEEALNKMPVCNSCKQHIQDEKFIRMPDGETLCNECEFDNARDLWLTWTRDQFLVEE